MCAVESAASPLRGWFLIGLGSILFGTSCVGALRSLACPQSYTPFLTLPHALQPLFLSSIRLTAHSASTPTLHSHPLCSQLCTFPHVSYDARPFCLLSLLFTELPNPSPTPRPSSVYGAFSLLQLYSLHTIPELYTYLQRCALLLALHPSHLFLRASRLLCSSLS